MKKIIIIILIMLLFGCFTYKGISVDTNGEQTRITGEGIDYDSRDYDNPQQVNEDALDDAIKKIQAE